jgi:hypothetical protein
LSFSSRQPAIICITSSISGVMEAKSASSAWDLRTATNSVKDCFVDWVSLKKASLRATTGCMSMNSSSMKDIQPLSVAVSYIGVLRWTSPLSRFWSARFTQLKR